MKAEVDKSRPARGLSSLGRERWISGNTRYMKLLQH